MDSELYNLISYEKFQESLIFKAMTIAVDSLQSCYDGSQKPFLWKKFFTNEFFPNSDGKNSRKPVLNCSKIIEKGTAFCCETIIFAGNWNAKQEM